jgi:nitrile hydratase
MNGVHDMGGMHGFGSVRHDEEASPFHAPWEGRVCAMMRALTRGRHAFSVDEMRRAIESLPPAQYLSATYFERWLAALRILLVEKGLVTASEVESMRRTLEQEPERARRAARRSDPALAAAILAEMERLPQRPREAAGARFRPGDRVVAKNQHVQGHTRLPRYVRGKEGVIHRVHGVYDFPDTKAHGRGDHPAPVYSVRFAARDLWGDAVSPRDSVHIDLWENYLDPA